MVFPIITTIITICIITSITPQTTNLVLTKSTTTTPKIHIIRTVGCILNYFDHTEIVRNIALNTSNISDPTPFQSSLTISQASNDTYLGILQFQRYHHQHTTQQIQ